MQTLRGHICIGGICVRLTSRKTVKLLKVVRSLGSISVTEDTTVNCQANTAPSSVA